MVRKLNQNKRLLLQNTIFSMFVLLIAFGLKYHYSHADSDNLMWILRPTAGLVECVSTIDFGEEEKTGFVSRERGVIIAPSCAGVNFFIVAFCVVAFYALQHHGRLTLKIIWLAITIATTYLATIFVNTIRILTSIYLYERFIYSVWITPERVHRLAGTLLYFFFLYILYVCMGKALHVMIARAKNKDDNGLIDMKSNPDYRRFLKTGLIPLIWYYMIAIVIPILNGAHQKNLPKFLEHCSVVISVSMLVFLFFLLVKLSFQRTVHAKNSKPQSLESA
jgi:exosortase K